MGFTRTNEVLGVLVKCYSIVALCVFAGLVGSGCETLPTSGADFTLVGDWEWVSSTGGIAGVTNTPASTGRTLSLTYRSDGSLDVFRDGALSRSVTFQATAVPGTDEWEIVYGAPVFGWDSQRAEIRSDTLILTDPCCDGFVHLFERNP